MDSSSIDLPGCEVESIEINGDRVILRFSRAYIIKTMTGSAERTRWWQAGSLVFERAVVEGSWPQMPAICSGGDVGENIYTYRDMIPIPLQSRGQAHCNLGFEGTDLRLRVQAEAVHLDMIDRPRYIEHIRAG
ncbi:MAG: hypothetical protein KDI18_12950 [Gammaproteobacteria bacterium]|nr:hypothetical protein [Gammaproteobacteria bacterium]